METDEYFKWRRPEGLYEKTDKVSPEKWGFPERDEFCVSSDGFICLRKKGKECFYLYSCDDLGLAYWDTHTLQDSYYEWEELDEFKLAFFQKIII